MSNGDNFNNQQKEQAKAEREGWNSEEIGNQASQKDKDEIQREMKRGDESKGNPDNRDEAGNTASNDTPQGREEAKKDTEAKANENG